jgi:hypothetical protein
MPARISRPLTLLLSFIVVIACSLSSSTALPTPTTSSLPLTAAIPIEITPSLAATTASVAPTIPAPVASTIKAYFTVAVIVDTTSELVTRDQAQQLINDTNRFFPQLTSFGFALTDFSEDGLGGSTHDMVNRYIQSHASFLPNGIVVFSFGDSGQAKLSGGYSYSVPGPAGYRNAFVSPVVGGNQIYIAVVHFSHRYAACGYGGADTPRSSVSIGTECRNRPGTACVQRNGYSMCADAVGNLYASTPTYFAASTVIAGFLHPFFSGGKEDYYATPECNAHMGYPQGFFDLQESEYYNGVCPFVYDNFKNSYQP